MTEPNHIPCHLVQDLLIPYAAGEVQPDTVQWVNHHLNGCEACRASLAGIMQGAGDMHAGIQAAPPGPDPGRRLVGRVRRQVIFLTVLVVTCVALVIGGATWAFSAMQRWADTPENHPAPALSVEPVQAAQVDLSPIGLTALGTESVTDGAMTRYEEPSGQIVTIGYYRLSSPYRAGQAFDRWDDSFRVKLMSVRTGSGTVGASTFRSGGHYYQGWHDGRWFITIEIPEQVTDATTLRDAIRQRMAEAFAH